MKLCKLLLLLLGTVLTGQAKRPNIVLIMADDSGLFRSRLLRIGN